MCRRPNAALRWAIAAASLAFLLPAAWARQPAVSMKMYDAAGRPVGNQEPTVQVKATGSVVDADTGQPLPAFHLITGTLARDHMSYDWSEQKPLLYVNGAFTVLLTKGKLPPAVLIEAKGYLPQRSDPIRGPDTNIVFRLKRGAGPAGVVLTPAGLPAAGRTVYLSHLKDMLYLEGANMTPKPSPRMRSTTTDQAGRFSFDPDLDAFSVLAADQDGFANVSVDDLASSPQLRLQPWGRVEGALKVGNLPGANQTIQLADAFAEYAYYPRPAPPYKILAEAATDAQGRFVFPRVPPVDIKICHVLKVGPAGAEQPAVTQITNLTLKAGEKRQVDLGGEGRPVAGRLILKNYPKPPRWQDQFFWIDSLDPMPADRPKFDAINAQYHQARRTAKTQADVEAAEDQYVAGYARVARQLRAYYSSPEGRRYWFSRRSYVLRLEPDGSFRIDDVPGGKYELNIDLLDFADKVGHHHAPRIDMRRQEIDVPDSPGGRSDTPLDLGVIRLVAQLIQGQTAPDFTVKTADDKTIKLSDYRGKYVLLDFWASWDAPSVAAMPDLKETYDAFKTDPRFAMIGLNLDTNAATARAFAIQNKLDWTQARLGPWSKSGVPDHFGVESLPFVLLLDQRGNVLSLGLHGGNIRSAVDSALNP